MTRFFSSSQQFRVEPVYKCSENVVSAAGAQVVMPESAISGKGLLGISRHHQASHGPEDLEQIGPVYSLTMAGADLTGLARVILPYDSELVPEGVSENDLVLGRYGETTGDWTLLSGAAAILEMVSGDGGEEEAGASRTLTIRVTDQHGNLVSGHPVDWSIESGEGSVSDSTTQTGEDGETSVTWTLGTSVGMQHVHADSDGLSGAPVEFSVDVVSGPATQLLVTTQPSETVRSVGAINDQHLVPHPEVQLQDSGGNDVDDAGVEISAALVDDELGQLNGTLTVSTGDTGSATFSDLSIVGTASVPHVLLFTAGELDSATSQAISLLPGEAHQLGIIVQPPAVTRSGDELDPQPVVQVQDSGGNHLFKQGLLVTAIIIGGSVDLTPPAASAITDTTGQATFEDLTISGLAGEGIVLEFFGGTLEPAFSNPIELTPGDPAMLGPGSQPSLDVPAGVVFPQQPAVQVFDSSGNPVGESGVTVNVEIGSGEGTLAGTLSATTNEHGLAEFTDLRKRAG